MKSKFQVITKLSHLSTNLLILPRIKQSEINTKADSTKKQSDL